MKSGGGGSVSGAGRAEGRADELFGDAAAAAAAVDNGKAKASLKRGVNLGPSGDEPREKKARPALGGLASLKGLIKKKSVGGAVAAATKVDSNPLPAAAAAAAPVAVSTIVNGGSRGGGLLGSDYSDSD